MKRNAFLMPKVNDKKNLKMYSARLEQPSDAGSWCLVSILRNDNVTCRCRLFFLMSPVKSKKYLNVPWRYPIRVTVTCHYASCTLSNLRNGHVAVSMGV